MEYNFIFYIIFGVLPSLVWLFYYLSKDLHPEPKKAILKVFLWGMVMTLPVFFIQKGLASLLGYLPIPTMARTILYWFFVIAFIEELFKFLVVRVRAFRGIDIDEPLDIMLYMVISALGFTALENILYLFNPNTTILSLEKLIQTTLVLSLVRFVGATFLHTLSSAVIGYFLALEASAPARKFFYTETGFLIAVALHGGYDLLIINLQNYQTLISLSAILLTFGFLTFFGFEKLKKMKSVSEVVIE